MARKPNYKFERMERDRAKAAKKAARLQAKADKAEARKAEQNPAVDQDLSAEEPEDKADGPTEP